MRYPGAAWRPCSNYSAMAPSEYLGLVLHVQQGTGSLRDYFSRPGGQVSSHFWVARTGRVEQYVDTAYVAWAQAEGNRTYCSVETEGYNDEPLTPAQVRALAPLYSWGMGAHRWPAQLAEQPGQHGFGWHGMGGAAWGNHPHCPGTLRKAQRQDVLALIRPTEEDWLEMATKDEVKDAIREVLRETTALQSDEPNEPTQSRDQALYRAYSNSRKALGKVPDQP